MNESRFKRYDIYSIKPKDTIYSIAKSYGVTMEDIFTANPGINPLELFEGQKIVVPYKTSIVKPDIAYTYETCQEDILNLKIRYPYLECKSIGKSVLGKDIYLIKIGEGKNEVFLNGSHHGNEWITSLLLMKFAEDFLKAYSKGNLIKSYDPKNIWKESSIYIVPMVNPDGVNLSINGISASGIYYKNVLSINGGSYDFSRWSSNIRGVDLNRNYNAGWDVSKKREIKYGIFGPSWSGYSGQYPESEPETISIVNFTRSHDFKLTISYHAPGDIIYWSYNGIKILTSKKIGEILSSVSGYRLNEDENVISCSSYKDWFIKEYRRPSYTIQIGKGKNPLPLYMFEDIYNRNLELILIASSI